MHTFEVLEALSRRGEVAREIAEVKKDLGLPMFDPVRERELLDRLHDAVPARRGEAQEEMTHALVIGGGPAGAALATRLARAGREGGPVDKVCGEWDHS